MSKKINKQIHFFPNANKNPIDYMLKISKVSASFAFMTITQTGLKKSIMDATIAVRFFLKDSALHDYAEQRQGQNYKKTINAHLVNEDKIIKSKASLYRPMTKKGDPRIWFSGLKQYASEKDLILLFAIKKELYLANLSNGRIWNSFVTKGQLFQLLTSSSKETINIRDELIEVLRKINKKGLIEATTKGATAVGDTLEHELGIKRNNSTNPDYKGIELKASRTRNKGSRKQKNRITLFSKVPDAGMTYRKILNKYGKFQKPKGSSNFRWQLYDTLKSKRVNSYGLFLKVNDKDKRLDMFYSQVKKVNDSSKKYVSSWKYDNLTSILKKKHKETFFVEAHSKKINGIEYFRYDKVLYTQNPNTSLLFALFEYDTITVDLLAHISKKKYRDHGCLFKIHPDSLSLLFGTQEPIDLN
jgi:hypothetical protein